MKINGERVKTSHLPGKEFAYSWCAHLGPLNINKGPWGFAHDRKGAIEDLQIVMSKENE